ncbi:endogenous retrovirus group K member 18 Pol protein-like protein [Willisornis vidua]|uniref:ribonuclease H n=1 Tax=Willisornis vidua TaxID=1566151 RepID=A0ABQ9D4W2_9PASS|nr:endogenous retrovirus group K member 18 Pol protein-like protein [Willisornis vidua]
MRNSPTICQRVIAEILSPIYRRFPEAICYHYMDDILLAAETQDQLTQVHLSVKSALISHALEIALSKEQLTSPWKSLGFRINETTIQPQKIALLADVQTLNDLQILLRKIN